MTRPDRILIVSHETTDDRTRPGPERDRAISKRRRREARREVYEWMEIIDHCGCWWLCCCCRGSCGAQSEEVNGNER